VTIRCIPFDPEVPRRSTGSVCHLRGKPSLRRVLFAKIVLRELSVSVRRGRGEGLEHLRQRDGFCCEIGSYGFPAGPFRQTDRRQTSQQQFHVPLRPFGQFHSKRLLHTAGSNVPIERHPVDRGSGCSLENGSSGKHVSRPLSGGPDLPAASQRFKIDHACPAHQDKETSGPKSARNSRAPRNPWFSVVTPANTNTASEEDKHLVQRCWHTILPQAPRDRATRGHRP